MEIYSDDNKKVVSIESSVLKSVFSTVYVRLEKTKSDVDLALMFLREGTCAHKNALETARQMNLIRDRFALIKPLDAIWDYENVSAVAPWAKGMSPVITSCANMYTTSDGKDLLSELVSLLVYSHYYKSDVVTNRPS